MRAYIHATDEVGEKVQRVLAKAKALAGVSEPISFHPLPDTVTPPRGFPVLSLGAYKRRGQENCVVTYSPAQIVTKPDALSHLTHAFRVLTGAHDLPEFQYRVFENGVDASWVLGDLACTTFAVDIETKGDVDSQVPSWDEIISIGFYDGTEAYIVPEGLLDDPAVRETIADVMSKSTCILANGKFDLKYIGAVPRVFEDTMLQHYALYPAATYHGLKETAEELFGAEDWDKAMKKDYLKKEVVKAHEEREDGAYAQPMTYSAQNGYERIPRDLLYKYNAWDVYWTYHIHKVLSEYMETDSDAQRLYHEHLIPLSFMYQDIESHGIRFDVNYMIDLADTLTHEGEQLQKDLDDIAGRQINPRSPKQVKEWFAEQGVSTKTTNEAWLVEHIENRQTGVTVDFAKKLLELRKNAKMNGTYITGYLNKLIGDRGYPGFKLHASITGRLGGAGPSMLTIPRDKRIKKMVLPDEGHVVVGADASQMELRIMALESQDEWMISAFQPDAGDFFDNLMHSVYPDIDPVALKAEDINTYSNTRAKIKGVIYGSSFGRGVKAIAASLEIPISEAETLLNGFVRPGSTFDLWRKKIMSDATGAAVLRNPFGRKYQAEVVTYRNRPNIERSGLSFPSQSTGNDLLLSAALRVHATLLEHYPDQAKFLGTIHDAIYLTCQPSVAEELGEMVSNEIIASGVRIYGNQVEFVSEWGIGNNLAEA